MTSRNPQREQLILNEFVNNHRSMTDIGNLLGISKQRVQQILSKHNLNSSHGGAREKAKIKRKSESLRIQKQRNEKCQRVYGCDYDTAMQLNGNKPFDTSGSPTRRYKTYKANNQRKGLIFNLSFPEWYAIWIRSGKYNDMGVGKGKYCMVKIDPSMPITYDNVKIILFDEVNRS